MGSDDKFNYESLPIPTYEEATSSRPISSQSHRGSTEISNDAERQGLLRRGDSAGDSSRSHPAGYHPPTVESARSSLDFLASDDGESARGSMEELQREMQEMDVEDPAHPGSSRSHLGQRFSKRFNTLTRTLSSIHLPLRKYFPKFNFSFISNLTDRWRSRGEYQVCLIILRLVGLIIVVTIVYLVVATDLFSIGGTRLSIGQSYTPSSVQNYVQGHINETSIAEKFERLTRFPHMAGTEGSYVLAEWIEQEFRKAGLDEVGMEEFQVYLNYPKPTGRRVAIVDPPELAWEAVLDEEQAYKDPPQQQTLVFHGHSKSGNVTGPLVYANYGSREDFKLLADKGISLQGAIVLVRYYGTQGDRALKIKAAEMAGAAGCIIYSDPAEDGFVLGPTYPDGRFMPADGVQRGGVSLMSWVVGDVLTPGFASTPDEKKRLSPEESPGLNQIPSIPIAWRDAQRLLQVLKGHGEKVPKKWVGGVPDISEWWTGDSSSPKVNLMNLQDDIERQPIYNVIGRIIGLEQPEKKIIVGNHRDAWCFGGVDPGSGTAVFLEVVRVFGELLALGWRPLRTIEFASWDGEEYNLIGSTEHVENELDALRNNGYAYLNVDVAVSGGEFRAAGSPLYERILLQILNRCSDPVANQTLKEIWQSKNQRLSGLGAGSDYVAFQDIAGTSSIDFGFVGEPYPYHSCYDNYEWMTQFGDPGFRYHKSLGEIWGLLLLELSENPILPFDMEAYAAYLSSYVSELDEYAKSKIESMQSRDGSLGGSKPALNMTPLYDAATNFKENAARFHEWDQLWHDTVWGAGGFETNIMAIKRMSHNTRMANFETHILDLDEGGGVPNRTQFKHVIFGPQAWSGYDEAFFPAIRDAIDAGDWEETQKWIDKIGDIISKASRKLLY
ncbi:hypothetical protein DTO212C5_4659 [Paecilomyces variotii]|nr:hypothetical protein DTO212C5_4659 [Paecilomyces variotii]